MEKKEVKSFFGKPTPLGEVLEGFLKEGSFLKYTVLFCFLVLRVVSI